MDTFREPSFIATDSEEDDSPINSDLSRSYIASTDGSSDEADSVQPIGEKRNTRRIVSDSESASDVEEASATVSAANDIVELDDTQNFIANTKFNSTLVVDSKAENAERDLSSQNTEVIIEPSEEIIISDSEDNASSAPLQKKNVTIQPTLHQYLNKTAMPVESSPPKRQVSRLEYVRMREKLENLNYDNRKLQNALNTIQLEDLPDKGASLLLKKKQLEEMIKEEQEKFEKIEVKDEPVQHVVTWKGIETGANGVQPRTFGKVAMQTYNTEKALTLDRLHNLHSSLKSCPSSDTLAEDPQGLKVDLMWHQKHALAWLMWREQQKPAGGILADDMGLGKTLTMISLICASKQINQGKEAAESDSDDERENEEEETNFKYKGGTLVVCPASLLTQWVNEIEDKLDYGLLSVESYHGAKRETKAKRLARYDVVVTTYTICAVDTHKTSSPLYRIKWDRIILDEAHQIRNHKSKTSMAAFRLGAKKRWVLTGTPLQNKEMDLFALLKFLRCSPFDDIAVFKRWISEKASGGHQRMHTVLSSMLLRRTKEQLKDQEHLKCLPEREWQLIEISMDKDEMKVYQKILLFSKTLFAQFLHQRAEKNADNMMPDYELRGLNNPSNEYNKMHQKLLKMNKLPEVKSSDILVLLLRLRQICCHPSLILAMLENVAELGEDVSEADISMNVLDQLNNLTLNDETNRTDETAEVAVTPNPGVGLAEATKGILNASNPVFEKDRPSTKLREVLKLLSEKILVNDDKVIIVSQWTSFLHILAPHLEALNVQFCQLDGTIPVNKRGELVNSFNDANSKLRIMLLSLTAGGVGLNLVGANHLIFVDLHWNPQLEMQAQDRIYRVGQRKKVFIYKLMTVETIEQRIKHLQDQKKELAEAVLKGAKMKNTKLSLDDLKMLFNM